MSATSHIRISRSERHARRAFSLIEILVAVSLLAVIILGLVAMFNQTRRAFTTSITQADLTQSGRIAMGLITSEMEQMTPSGGTLLTTNFYVDAPITTAYSKRYLTQPLVDSNDIRTNNMQRVFFLTFDSAQVWHGIGYTLDPTNFQNGIGTLYRYSTHVANSNAWMLANLAGAFWTMPVSNMSRLVNGVVDFRIRPYDTNGNPFLGVLYSSPSSPYVPNSGGSVAIYTNELNDTICAFTSNSVPAYVEVELGILEDRALARYQSLAIGPTGPGSASWTYLMNHPGQVHVFRQRITIRNINPAAY